MQDNNIISEENIKGLWIGLKGGSCTMKTNSMAPTIMPGWKVKVIPVTPEKINTGDIGLFYRNNKLICHRLVARFAKKEGGFFFWEKGDINAGFGVVDDKDILGRVVEIRDEDGNIVKSKYWKRRNPKGALFVFLYRNLIILRRIIFRERKNLITHILGALFWKVYYKYYYNPNKTHQNRPA